MIKKRNWTIPVIIGGIVFFTFVGILISSAYFSLNVYSNTIITYCCIGLFFVSFLSLEIFKNDFYKKTQSQKLEIGIFYPLSLLLNSIVIENSIYPIITFIFLLISWILWALLRFKNKGDNLSIINVLIISWIILSITLSIGQILGYSDILISKIYGFSMFLDLRISLSILIFAILVVVSLGRIDFSKIETKDFLIIENDKKNPILNIVELFYLLANFLIKFVWWLGVFIILWGQEFVNEIKKRYVENKNSLFDFAIIIFSIMGLFICFVFSKHLNSNYFPTNNTIKEIIPFFISTLLVCTILISAYLIIRFRYLNWNDWTPSVSKKDLEIADRNYREALGFPIFTSGIAGIILYFLSKIDSLQFLYFKNFGLFSLLLTIGLILAIIFTISKHLSKQDNI
ncbi:MAG: hypothetical protein K9J13_14320 [Saprospiraceae bacterium]|nr:hypothetical protein [Saprospiraceae bacterium]